MIFFFFYLQYVEKMCNLHNYLMEFDKNCNIVLISNCLTFYLIIDALLISSKSLLKQTQFIFHLSSEQFMVEHPSGCWSFRRLTPDLQSHSAAHY